MNRWAVIFILALGPALWAAGQEAPELMNYQGTLVDSAGQPAATGAYALQFRVWNAATGGSDLWGPQIFDGAAGTGHSGQVNIVDGAFNVVLGPLDTSGRSLIGIVDESDAYLQIAVQDTVTKAYTWLTPRQRILSAPFALKASMASNAQTLNGVDADFLRNANNLSAGTLSTDRFSAAADLTAEGKLDNNEAADLLTRAQADTRYANEGQANSVTSAMIVDHTIAADDVADGTTLAELLDDDGTGSGLDADLLDGLHVAFLRNADNLNAGTVSTDRYSANADLTAEGMLDNNAGTDLLTRAQADTRYTNEGQAGSVTSAMLVDGSGSGMDADLLDGQDSAFFRNAANVNAGTLSTDRYSAYADLTTEGRIGRGADLVASGDHMVHGPTNTASGTDCTLGGGRDNAVSGQSATLCGGVHNVVSSDWATVSGGSSNTASDQWATVGGGDYNTAAGFCATVGGGNSNDVQGGYSTASGGLDNSVPGQMASVGGGQGNTAENYYSTVAGGSANTASDGYATVGGGAVNTASGIASTVPGGQWNAAAGDYSFAAGYRAKSNYLGTFVWADATDIDFASDRVCQFKVRAGGGVYIYDNHGSSHLDPPALRVDCASGTGVAIHATQSSSDCTLVLGNGGTGDLIKAFSGPTQGNLIFRVDNAGNVTADGAFTSPARDFAEYLPKRDDAETMEPGDVVGMFADGLSKRTAGAERLMVITTKPLVLGNAREGEARTNHAAVAMLGQAPVKVRGPVQAGDYLVASGKHDGAAVAVSPAALTSSQFGQIVGCALESSPDAGVKPVLASVGLSHDKLWSQALQRHEQTWTKTLQAREEAWSQSLQERDSRIAAMQQELDALKTAVTALAAK